jgi:hypothetical protein
MTTITEAIAEAAEFIYATLDHAADCEIENTGDFNKHCEIDHDYVPHLKAIADVLRQYNELHTGNLNLESE